MCGLFEWVGKPLKDIAGLRRIAEHTEWKRGGHAYGWAWIASDGKLRHHKAAGTIREHADELDMLTGAVAIIGHCRWATHGSVARNINNHPHASLGGYIVHNGIVPGYLEIADRLGLTLTSECDSEVIARMIEVFDGTLEDKLVEALGYVESRCAVLGLWLKPSPQLVVGRTGNPLHLTLAARGTFIASLKESLPGRPMEFKDWHVSSLEVEVLKNVRHGKKESHVRGKPHAARVRVAV